MRYVLPIISLILLWAILPGVDWGILAWISLLPLFLFLRNNNTSVKEALLWGGLVVGGYVFLLLWPLTSVDVWWWVNPDSFIFEYKTLILIATITIGSLYGGFLPGALFGFLYKKNSNALFAGVAWGALELLRMPFVYDFTWVSLAYSQHDISWIISITPLITIAGLSGLIVVVNSLIAEALISKKWSYLGITTLIFIGVFAYNLLSPAQPSTETLTVSSLHLEIKTEDLYDKKSANKTLSLIQKELEITSPDILLTPENVFPFLILDKNFVPQNYTDSAFVQEIFDTLIEISKEYPGTSLVLGVHTRTPELRNSLAVLEDGVFTDVYHKENLLIFGERPPLPFTSGHIMPFTKGETSTLKIGNHVTEPLICSEVATHFTFSDKARFIVNINNDSIFTSPLVGLQNLYIAQLQAAEHNTYIIRSGKGGVTALISPDGIIQEKRTTTGFISGEISL